jgi:hypothetical protein
MTGFPMTLTPRPGPNIKVDRAMARATTLAGRLTPGWQDEAVMLDGLSKPNLQYWLVTKSGLAERRRIGGLSGVPLRWQLRLKV